MASYIPPAEFRRADWDLTWRSQPMVDALLAELSGATSRIDKENVVHRLAKYVARFPSDEVDGQKIDDGLKAADLDPLPLPSSAQGKRPFSKMHPENQNALRRSDGFQLNQVLGATRGQPREVQARIAEVGKLVRQFAGDQLNPTEFAEAMRLLESAKR